MPRVATRHAHKIAYRQRFSVGLRMLGCLVLLAGSLVLAVAVAEATKGRMSKSSWLMISLGLTFAAGGAVLLGGERGKLIDREERTVKRWWGVVKPLWHTTCDVQGYQSVSVEPCDNSGIVRWRVSMFGPQGERLKLFDLTNAEAAEGAARQVAMFLSLTIAPPPAVTGTAAAVTAPTELGPPVATSPPAPLDDRWVHSRRWPGRVRRLGIVLLAVVAVLLLGVVSSAVSHDERWWRWLAIAAPIFVLGLWLLVGGGKVAIDREQNTASVWQAWPLPPAVYDLAAFYAVIVAPAAAETPDGEPATCLLGLIGPEQLRLELIRSISCDEARAAATQLAATTKLPLIDESQPAVRTV